MAERLRGIVLRTVKYGERGLVVDMLTDQRGRLSIMANIGKGRRSTPSTGLLWRPLNMIEFEAEVRSSGPMPKPKSERLYYVYTDLPYNYYKEMTAMFLSEFLSAALRNQEPDAVLYAYIEHALQWFDAAQQGTANFHIFFVLRLLRLMGIAPNTDDATLDAWFDLRNGCYTAVPPLHAHRLEPAEARWLALLLRMDYATMHRFRLSRQGRHRILSVVNDFCRLHVPGFPELRSLNVLSDVLD